VTSLGRCSPVLPKNIPQLLLSNGTVEGKALPKVSRIPTCVSLCRNACGADAARVGLIHRGA
jgi:hypothetical protein